MTLMFTRSVSPGANSGTARAAMSFAICSFSICSITFMSLLLVFHSSRFGTGAHRPGLVHARLVAGPQIGPAFARDSFRLGQAPGADVLVVARQQGVGHGA